ncbi:MAG: peptidase domain-containing ABC transporter [Salinivirgaceae bacterium]|nr:peptidase domain-containing ABC transporter [Salinivirgaceae bacterium]
MNRKQIEKAFVKQHDATDCGAACLLALIRYYGGDSTIQHLRELSGTTVRGTTLLGLYQAAQAAGFEAEGCKADTNALIEHGKPVILHLTLENKYEHYVVCYGFQNGQFIIGDPAKGIVSYGAEELNALWLSKMCLTLEPNKGFKMQKDISTQKKQWIKKLITDDIGILSASAVIGIAIAVLGMVMSVFSQKLVDEVLPEKNVRKLVLGLVLVGVLLMIRIFVTAIRQKLMITQSRNFNNRIIDFFYERLLSLPKPFFDTRKIGDMVARLNDTRRIQSVISSLAGNTVIDVLVALTSIVFMFYYSWQVGIIAVVCMPLFFYIIYRYNKQIIAQQKAVMVGYAQTESNFINTINGVATIKNFNRQNVFQKINTFVYNAFQNKVYDLGTTQIRIGVASGMAGNAILIGIIAYSAFRVIGGGISIGEMMAIIGISGTLFPSIANLALVAIPINEAKVAFNRMFEIAGNETENDVSAEEKAVDTVAELSVSNINFRFVGHKLLLNNVSLVFKRGTITSITGESGCGKSTLCQIIERFYAPESGCVSINGTNINDYPLGQYRNLISVVPQDVYIFNGTVADNICFGAAPTDLNEVWGFCTKYGFDKFIATLPQGLMTIVGEEGINLSGGQKQLLAFARALYNPSQILILDEMTAAMDRITENFICNLLQTLKHDKIIIFVTHRLHTAKLISDNIVVMGNGKVECQGTHSQLMETDNFYSQFWHAIEY